MSYIPARHILIFMQTGWIVTIANVGDSFVCVETKAGGMKMVAVDHRLERNEEEAERLRKSGLKAWACGLPPYPEISTLSLG